MRFTNFTEPLGWIKFRVFWEGSGEPLFYTKKGSPENLPTVLRDVATAAQLNLTGVIEVLSAELASTCGCIQ